MCDEAAGAFVEGERLVTEMKGKTHSGSASVGFLTLSHSHRWMTSFSLGGHHLAVIR